MLEGEKVNLRVLEKEDLDFIWKWGNDPAFGGEFEALEQISRTDVERWYEELPSGEKWFIVEKKDGAMIGQILARLEGPHYAIGYRIIPDERDKGYCTEAVKILVDYLFLSTDVVRVQAQTSPDNKASIRVLEKAGFTREGVIRKSIHVRGRWRDGVLYSMLRDEWGEPRVLKGLA